MGPRLDGVVVRGRQENSIMKKSTEIEYIKLARNFMQKRLVDKGIDITPRHISIELAACAAEYRPAYWRRLRRALVVSQREQGFNKAADRLEKLVNPVTAEGSALDVKQKQRRVKSIKHADEIKLLDYLNEKGDYELIAAITLARFTGARPAEFQGIYVEDERAYISGAKKSHAGKRGADRSMILEPDSADAVAGAVELLAEANIGAMQDRLRAVGKRLWPRRKAVPTLYSWRHQLGAELKASGMDRTRVAYLMGHQATQSVDRYGNRRTAKGGPLPKIPAGADLSEIRQNHNQPPGSVKSDLYGKPQSPAEMAAKTTEKTEISSKSQKKQRLDSGMGMG